MKRNIRLFLSQPKPVLFILVLLANILLTNIWNLAAYFAGRFDLMAQKDYVFIVAISTVLCVVGISAYIITRTRSTSFKTPSAYASTLLLTVHNCTVSDDVFKAVSKGNAKSASAVYVLAIVIVTVIFLGIWFAYFEKFFLEQDTPDKLLANPE